MTPTVMLPELHVMESEGASLFSFLCVSVTRRTRGEKEEKGKDGWRNEKEEGEETCVPEKGRAVMKV